MLRSVLIAGFIMVQASIVLAQGAPAAPAQTPPASVPSASAPAGSAAPTELGTFGAWTAYTLQGDKGRSCYIASKPATSEPQGAKRDPIHFFITHRPQEKIRNEISIIIGYSFKEAGKASMDVVGAAPQKYVLLTADQGAWLEMPSQEAGAVEALRKGREIVIKGTSKRGTVTTDRYSLTGISAALEKIAQECK